MKDQTTRTAGTAPRNGRPRPVKFTAPPSIYGRSIREHGGGKYLVTIHPADGVGAPINVDVYCMLEALGVTCPALQQAFKKIAFCGRRGKGDEIADIHGVFDAMWRALELQMQRDGARGRRSPTVPRARPRPAPRPPGAAGAKTGNGGPQRGNAARAANKHKNVTGTLPGVTR